MPFPLPIATFGIRFPEFAPTIAENEALVQAKLDEAEREIDERVWAAKAEDGQGNLAAHLLSLSGYGRDARLKKDSTQTTYGQRYEEMQRVVGTAYRMVLE